MDALAKLVSGWNGNIIFWICVGVTAVAFALAATLCFRARVLAVPVTVAVGLSSALLCYFLTSYGAQAEFSALYAAILVALTVLFTVVSVILDAVSRRKRRAKRDEETPRAPVTFTERECEQEICTAVAPAVDVETRECAVVSVPETVSEEDEDKFDAVLPDSALPSMSLEEVDNAVSEAEAAGAITSEEGKALVMQIAKLRALPSAGQEEKKKLNALQKRIAEIFSKQK